MLSLRLQTIASFLSREDRVVDIGCDHAFLPVYLLKNNICQTVMATDVNIHALENAQQNIKNAGFTKQIPVILSNGLEKVRQEDFDTLVLSGMGSSTILKILESVKKENIKKLIIQSNNDLFLLRMTLKKRKYYLQEEKIVFEKGHYYVIGKYTLCRSKLSLRTLLFGKYNYNYISYYSYLYKGMKTIVENIQNKNITNITKKLKIIFKMKLLKKYL